MGAFMRANDGNATYAGTSGVTLQQPAAVSENGEANVDRVTGAPDWSAPPGVSFALEPIQKVVESEESVVIRCLAPESMLRGAGCGILNTIVRPYSGSARSDFCALQDFCGFPSLHIAPTVEDGAKLLSACAWWGWA